MIRIYGIGRQTWIFRISSQSRLWFFVPFAINFLTADAFWLFAFVKSAREVKWRKKNKESTSRQSILLVYRPNTRPNTRCYFFNLVETPTFVTTGYLSETFCENPKCGHPEKNDNDQAWEKWQWTSSEAIFLVVIFQHLRPRSGPQADQRSTSVPFINKIWKIQIWKIWILIAQKESSLSVALLLSQI